MTIDKTQLDSLVIDACPSLAHGADYKEWLASKEDGCEPLYYSLASALSSHVVTNFELFSKSDQLEKIFSLIEKLEVEGDEYVTTWSTVGFMEGLQNQIINRKLESELFPRCEKYLGAESKFWWQELILFWRKEIPYLGASRAASK